MARISLSPANHPTAPSGRDSSGAVDAAAPERRWRVAPAAGDDVTHLCASYGRRFGSCVRQLREQAGLSQRELAALTGTTQSAVARLEADRQEPTLRTLEKLAAALGQDLVLFIPTEAQA
ncbi:MAG TPA: helix-turn-helix transcriptional regulator [Frankiaceae bacterium]|nr:helix-turn-helix transcriptional regulator [Frankiaceae bacterium]